MGHVRLLSLRGGSGDPPRKPGKGDSPRFQTAGNGCSPLFLAALTVTVAALGLAACTCGAEIPPWDTFSDTWVGADALGRALPGPQECGPPREGKAVGIFYFLWLTGQGAVYDNTKSLAADAANPKYGPLRAFHFWSEPLFGYYQSKDSSVIRKHAQMLADAGVDVLICDVTNAFTYDDTVLAVCKVLDEIRRSGQRTPQIAFISWSSSAKTVQRLYDNFYSKNLYPELWYRWKGKPLVLAPDEGLSPEVRGFFTVRKSWAWTAPKGWFGDGKDCWPWVDHTPQQPGWHESPDKPEEICVCIAEHPTGNIGRSFHGGKQPPPGQTAPEKGLYFAEQWKRALEVNPEFAFITGWNEWVAQRFENKGGIRFLGRKLEAGETFFVDQYNQEFSRDAEPMKGGHGDNYYYQMAAGIRRFKGVRTLPPVTPQPIAIDGKFDDWKNVGPEFRDTLGDPVQRNFAGWKGVGPYVNATGRNDIAAAKVSWDAANVYFYVRTREPLTPCTGPNWMLLFIDADNNPATGWLGYDCVVNRTVMGPQMTSLQRNLGGAYKWGSPVIVGYRAAGNELELAIPRAALGITKLPAVIDFKWADNIQQTGDASDFTLNGDAAPNDRFNYRATLVAPAVAAQK